MRETKCVLTDCKDAKLQHCVLTFRFEWKVFSNDTLRKLRHGFTKLIAYKREKCDESRDNKQSILYITNIILVLVIKNYKQTREKYFITIQILKPNLSLPFSNEFKKFKNLLTILSVRWFITDWLLCWHFCVNIRSTISHIYLTFYQRGRIQKINKNNVFSYSRHLVLFKRQGLFEKCKQQKNVNKTFRLFYAKIKKENTSVYTNKIKSATNYLSNCRCSILHGIFRIHPRVDSSYIVRLHIFTTIFFCVVSCEISFIDHKYSTVLVIQDLSMCLCAFLCLFECV